jgi:hypothetical protein
MTKMTPIVDFLTIEIIRRLVLLMNPDSDSTISLDDESRFGFAMSMTKMTPTVDFLTTEIDD